MKERELLDAIIADDLHSFAQFSEPDRYRYGRFPVLSLLYLYKSKRILSRYEREFWETDEYIELDEPFELSVKFSEIAGKCLRLYKKAIVSPLEMLLLMHEYGKCGRLYPKIKPDGKVDRRLNAIYNIRYHKSLRFEENKIRFARRPLSFAQKRRLKMLIAGASALVAVALLFVVNAFVPFLWKSETDVWNGGTKPAEAQHETLGNIDFTSEETFTLEEDLIIPEDFVSDSVNCTIDGNGYAVRVKDTGVHFKALYGTFRNVKFVTEGAAVFGTIGVGAEVIDCRIEATLKGKVSSGFAPLALNNYGKVERVSAIVTGNLTAEYGEGVTEEGGLMAAGLVRTNAQGRVGFTQYYGTIADCTVALDLTLHGQVEANASFAGIAATNSGVISGCSTSGRLTSDTFDLAGICVENNRSLVSDTNHAEISTSSADGRWNPLAVGIVMTNNYAVQKCVNNGNITSVSTGVSENTDFSIMTSASGIAMTNAYAIEHCENNGKISSRSLGASQAENYTSTAAAGGICINAYGYIYQAKNTGEVTAEGVYDVFLGGIAAEGYSELVQCVSAGKLTATGNTLYVGGILGFSITTAVSSRAAYGIVNTCVSGGEIVVEHIKAAYVGGAVGYIQQREFSYIGSNQKVTFGGNVNTTFFTGSISAKEGANVGTMAGACGKYLYENNEGSNGEAHFKDNCYVKCGSFLAIGITVDFDEEGNMLTAEGSDLGACTQTLSEMEENETYRSVLSSAGNV